MIFNKKKTELFSNSLKYSLNLIQVKFVKKMLYVGLFTFWTTFSCSNQLPFNKTTFQRYYWINK